MVPPPPVTVAVIVYEVVVVGEKLAAMLWFATTFVNV